MPSLKANGETDRCVECNKVIHSSEKYHYSKVKRGGRVKFIHTECWDRLLREGLS